MSIAFVTALLLAPLTPSSPPFTAPPPPVAGRGGVGGDIEQQLALLHSDLLSAEASGDISSAAAEDLHGRVERIRRQIVRMGDVVGHRQRLRLRARIDALRSQLAQSRGAAGVEG